MSLDAFRQLTAQVGDVLERQLPGVDYSKIEPLLYRLVQVIEDNPGLREDFERELRGLLTLRNFGAPEIMQYAMHILGWPSMKDATRQALDECADARRRRVLERIYESFDPGWEDRDLFARFRDGA